MTEAARGDSRPAGDLGPLAERHAAQLQGSVLHLYTGHSRKDITIATSAFVITGDSHTEMGAVREKVRQQIAFYASTWTYKPVWDRGDVCLRLSEKAAKGAWESMAKEMTDDMLAEFAVTGSPEEVPGLLKAKYNGLLDRAMFYHADRPGQNVPRWRKIIEAFQTYPRDGRRALRSWLPVCTQPFNSAGRGGQRPVPPRATPPAASDARGLYGRCLRLQPRIPSPSPLRQSGRTRAVR